jgi:hypothetical protein
MSTDPGLGSGQTSTPGERPRCRGGRRGVPGGSALREYHRQLALYRATRRSCWQYLTAGAIAGGIAGWLATVTALALARSAFRAYDQHTAQVRAGSSPAVPAHLTVAQTSLAAIVAASAGLVVLVLALRVAWQRWARVPQPVTAWQRGAAGEQQVARALAPLAASGWIVLHDRALPRTGANLDHLVIGPTGIYAIDTKNYRGRVWFDGHRLRISTRDFHTAAAGVTFAARRAHQGIANALQRPGWDPVVTPVLCLAGHSLAPTGEGEVAVVGLGQLVAYFAARPAHLTPLHVAELAAAAELALPAYAA